MVPEDIEDLNASRFLLVVFQFFHYHSLASLFVEALIITTKRTAPAHTLALIPVPSLAFIASLFKLAGTTSRKGYYKNLISFISISSKIFLNGQ